MRLLLRSKHWDSRLAAGDCLGLIAEHCVHHSAAELQQAAGSAGAVKSEPGSGDEPGAPLAESDAPLSFHSFHIEQVMAKGAVLLASGGTVRFLTRGPGILNCGDVNEKM